MARKEFSEITKNLAVGRQSALCAMCGLDFRKEDDPYHFHHIIPCNSGGDNSLDNCVMLCDDCHYDAHNYGNYRQPIQLLMSEFPYYSGPAIPKFGKGRKRK